MLGLSFELSDSVTEIALELRLFVSINAEMAEEKKSVDPALAGFYEAMRGPMLKRLLRKF